MASTGRSSVRPLGEQRFTAPQSPTCTLPAPVSRPSFNCLQGVPTRVKKCVWKSCVPKASPERAGAQRIPHARDLLYACQASPKGRSIAHLPLISYYVCGDAFFKVFLCGAAHPLVHNDPAPTLTHPNLFAHPNHTHTGQGSCPRHRGGPSRRENTRPGASLYASTRSFRGLDPMSALPRCVRSGERQWRPGATLNVSVSWLPTSRRRPWSRRRVPRPMR